MTFTEVKESYNISDNDLAPEVSDNLNLFDSDEEYNNNEKPTLGTEKLFKHYILMQIHNFLIESCKPTDIAINPIFEGEPGRERLNLQIKFHGDDRFKLTSDFVIDENNIVQNGDIDRVLSEEKTKQIGILKGLLGYVPKKADPKKFVNKWFC
ncbi:hypothetical protein C2G38_2029003 [Gigaspora rosea]|uniref:Uncharacterized protein n=1 Tax=Gigaspora rosea TaxID=44941 RepID=A0A397W6D9_9GLOM|nr:hypothetical protein C2G38_2029003 [Gigaspora rosea]